MRIGRVIGIVLVVLILLVLGVFVYADFSLKRTDALQDYGGRPAAGAGTNWLLVGSDSREGLTDAQKQELATGSAEGSRTDTILLLHIPGSGPSTLVSLLRDSYVDIPGHGKNKLNAAFAFGGAPLLQQTVEGATGLHVDHYMEIGFGGFSSVVDTIGGVNMCIDKAMVDPKAGLNLQPGCQDLTGAQALGYVRTRATPAADLDRVVHQRQFLSAVVSKVTSPGVLFNPFRIIPLMSSVPAALTVNNGDHVWNLASMAFSLASKDLVTTTVPISSTPTISGVGSVVLWNKDKATRLFDALRTDAAVPTDVLTGH
ncbi:LCP family protein [Kutzneria sp. NPDC052558]|uniref:LCP family protein n=1 Tax=Kutzneria sp. NPDC052558 TaxID=3364121 RepID=UPI0037C66713